MCRDGGHMLAPLKVFRRCHRRVNITVKHFAICSPIAASGVSAPIQARGHIIDKVVRFHSSSATRIAPRKKVLTESDREDETPCAKPLDVRGKYLPMIFEPQINLDFLQNNVARNLQVDSKHYIHTLRQIQQYMIPLVLNEIPFVVAGPAGAGKTTGYLLPLVNKLVELKEIEVQIPSLLGWVANCAGIH